MTNQEIQKAIKEAEKTVCVKIPKGCRRLVGSRGTSRSKFKVCNICGSESETYAANFPPTKAALTFELLHLIQCGNSAGNGIQHTVDLIRALVAGKNN